MNEAITCQGRLIPQSELRWLRNIVQEHPCWSRHKITKHICSQWEWRTHSGQLKTFAARSMIDKLELRGLLNLPPIRVAYRRSPRPPFSKGFIAPELKQIQKSLNDLTPLSIHIPTPNSYEDNCVGYFLNRYHYLGFNQTVGENIKYLVRDRSGQNVACLLFGSAAWKTAPRDSFIGWSREVREVNINFITNNTRFLILPQVRVPHLASHILGRIMHRIQKDWKSKYAHPIQMVETFVERDLFRGTCYKAANWLCVGQTKGRSRQDQHAKLSVPVKDILLYPLTKNFKQALCQSGA
ncbi:MAG: DUF4338 domain-containing protein [Anaerolineales bacterium]|nr:DUF4338 domain-containing protein [Anaerolineales bacterium]